MTRHSLGILALAGAWLLQQPAWSLDCGYPTLKDASGVIGSKHSYKIAGQCTETWSTTKTGAGSSTTTNKSVMFAFVGGASWDRASGSAQEKLSFSGDVSGTRYAEAVCTQDPFLKDPPGGPAGCGQIKVQVDIKSGPNFELLTKQSFWGARKISLAEAQALSAETPAAKPAPDSSPPKPKADVPKVGSASAPQGTTVTDKPVAPATGTTARQPRSPAPSRQPAAAGLPVQAEIEAEALAMSKAVVVAGGKAVVQPMGAFGTSWSGGEQLFWSGGSVGATLDLLVDVPAPSKYAIELYMTRAPDYGQVKIEVDGKPSAVPFDGMAPQVVQTGPTQVGTFPLQAGQRRISLMITGKHPQSTGFYVGIDKLRLYPAGPIE